MKLHSLQRAVFLSPMVLLTVVGSAYGQWPQWGGPHRDFVVRDGAKLAEAWPTGGPKVRWRKPLGNGYSSIAVEGGRLFTMMRADEREYVVCLRAENGSEAWRHGWDAPLFDGFFAQFGKGPHATPTVIDGRVFAIGATAKLVALDGSKGTVLWSRDLMKELEFTPMICGYACSPLPYKDTIILPAGGKGHGVVALRQKDGSTAWHALDIESSYASPILINLGGQEQLIVFSRKGINGLDPANGALLWEHAHSTQYDVHACTPVWDPERNELFISSAYGSGSELLRLQRVDGKTKVESRWSNRKMQIHHSNVIVEDGRIFGVSGDFGAKLFCCVNANDGEFVFRERGFTKASIVHADGKFIMLQEDGTLSLARPGSDGIRTLSSFPLFDTRSGPAWTSPTLVGKQLYARDRAEIVALDLN